MTPARWGVAGGSEVCVIREVALTTQTLCAEAIDSSLIRVIVADR